MHVCRQTIRNRVKRLFFPVGWHRRFDFEQIGGQDAVSSTLASTNKTVRTVKRQGARFSPRSRVGGDIDFGPLHTRSGRLNAYPSRSVDSSKRAGIEGSIHVDNNQSLRAGGSPGERGFQINNNSRGRWAQAGARVNDRVRALSTAVGRHRRAKTAPGGQGVDGFSSSPPSNQTRRRLSGYGTGRDGVGSATRSGDIHEEALGRVSTRENARPCARTGVVNDDQNPAAAARIRQTLAALPLSKIKIVIGKAPIETSIRKRHSL